MKSRVLGVRGATVALVAVCLATPPLAGAENAPSPAAQAAQPGERLATTGVIQGTAWRADNTPVPGALLRLRNAGSGRIQATAVASDDGTFSFRGVPAGTYVVEMVAPDGKVLVVGQAFTLSAGEAVATFVRLAPRVPWFTGFFGNAAQAIAVTAASTGITAVNPDEIPPVSAVR